MNKASWSPFTPIRTRLDLFGRDDALRWLQDWQTGGKRAVLITSSRAMGRSSLLHAYMEQAKGYYTRQAYLSGSSFLSAETVHLYLEAQLHQIVTAPNPRTQLDLVVLDDLHALSPQMEVARLLDQVSHDAPERRRWILTSGSQFIADASPAIARALTAFDHYFLGPLDEQSVEDLVRQRLRSAGIKKTSTDLLSVATRLGGNPHLVSLLMYHFISQGNLNEAMVQMTQRELNQALTNLLLMPVGERIVPVPASQMAPHQIITPNSSLLSTAPYVAITSLNLLWKPQLEEFEALLNDPGTREADYQRYFEANSHFLEGIQYERVVPHPILEREDQGVLIPDFALQPLGQEYCDILDLKLPTEKIVVGRKDRLRFSSAVHEAVAQVREYRDYFEDSRRRDAFSQKYGLRAYRPSLSVIIGRSTSIPDGIKLRQIRDQMPGYVSVTTYDELFAQMRRLAERLSG